TGLALLASRQLDRHGKIPPLLAIGAVVLVLLMTAGVWWLMIKKDEESSTSERGAPPASAEPKEAALAGEVSGAEYEKIHRRVTFHLWVLFLVSFAVVPVIVGGIVYGALRMSVLHGETSAQRISLIAFLGANPLLYLMANAVCLNQYRWKWLGLLIMSLGPFVLGYVFPDMWTEMVRTGIMLPKPAMLFVALVWLCSGFATLSLFCCRHPLRQTPL
ncbi:MAG TPA: hypothetical protein VLT36_00220, partial [Candidatus Dormibacteraeota bacterium]|nr:hypothetical protein [Candidatus Dormibacteraeota bacterium]